MTKLNDKQISRVSALYKKGVHFQKIADKYQISVKSVYNYLEVVKKRTKIDRPRCYKDYLINSILYIEDKIRNGKYEKQNISFAVSEVKRLRKALKTSITNMPEDAFTIQ